MAIDGREQKLQHTPYKCGTGCVDLCLTKKYVTARAAQQHLLNMRAEIISNVAIETNVQQKMLSNVVLDL